MSKCYDRQDATSFATYASSKHSYPDNFPINTNSYPETTGFENSHFEELPMKSRRSVRINDQDELYSADMNGNNDHLDCVEEEFIDRTIQRDFGSKPTEYTNEFKTIKKVIRSARNTNNASRREYISSREPFRSEHNYERHFSTRRNSYEVEYEEVEMPARPAYVANREVDTTTTETTTHKIEMPKTVKHVETVERVETRVPKPEKKIIKRITRKPQTVTVCERENRPVRFADEVRYYDGVERENCCDGCDTSYHTTTTRRLFPPRSCSNTRGKKVVCFEVDDENTMRRPGTKYYSGPENLAREMYEYYEVPVPKNRIKVIYSGPNNRAVKPRSNYFCSSDCWKSSSKPCPLCKGTGVVPGSTKKVGGWGSSVMNAARYLGNYSSGNGYSTYSHRHQPSNPTALYWKQHRRGGYDAWGRRGW